MKNLTLTQLANTIKSNWFLAGAFLLSLGIFVLFILSLGQGKTSKEPPGTAWQKDIFAGTTTRNELESKLGAPTKIEERGDGTSYFYSSTDQFRSHEIEITNDVINLIKEQVPDQNKGELSDYIQKYGQPEAVLFGPHGTFSPGHFWGQTGLLVFANKFDGTIVEIWYFKPATLEDFLSQHPDLSQQEPAVF